MNWSDHYFQVDNIYCVPSVHGSLDFAQILRTAFFEIAPDCIAVELPEAFMSSVLQGVRRLPYLSVLAFPDRHHRNHSTYHYIPIQPCDSIIEAVRLADEQGTELYFVDKDVQGVPIPKVLPPDTYYLTKLGLKTYCEEYLQGIQSSEHGSIHYRRELEMAFRVRKMAKVYKKVLFVYGLYHHNRITDFLQHPVEAPPSETIDRDEIQLMHIDESSYQEVLGTMPFQTYLYEIGRKGLTSFHMGIELPLEETHKQIEEGVKEAYLEKVREKAERLKSIKTLNSKVDQYDNLHEIVIQSRRLYNREWDDQAPAGKLSIAFKFARNYALVDDYLIPSPYQLIVAFKNTINDDFAWEMSRLLRFYPFVENQEALTRFNIQDQKGVIGRQKVKYESHFPIQPWLMEEIPIKKRLKEEHPGDWERTWNYGFDLVSYPAEDVIIENYFDYLRKKGKTILEKEHSRTVEFENSLLDGIDIKETLRNLHLGKLYVKEQQPIKGDVGTVVVIFDEKDEENKYSFQMTWYAEHPNESDLALYSTPPGEKLIGPGISRAEYGGLLSVFPPRGIRQVWTDERFDRAKTKAERLLMAGIQYSEKKHIIYVAPSPPKQYFHVLAERYGRHILYIPLSQLSDTMIKKVKYFHFLADRRLRGIASRYIRL